MSASPFRERASRLEDIEDEVDYDNDSLDHHDSEEEDALSEHPFIGVDAGDQGSEESEPTNEGSTKSDSIEQDHADIDANSFESTSNEENTPIASEHTIEEDESIHEYSSSEEGQLESDAPSHHESDKEEGSSSSDSDASEVELALELVRQWNESQEALDTESSSAGSPESSVAQGFTEKQPVQSSPAGFSGSFPASPSETFIAQGSTEELPPIPEICVTPPREDAPGSPIAQEVVEQEPIVPQNRVSPPPKATPEPPKKKGKEEIAVPKVPKPQKVTPSAAFLQSIIREATKPDQRDLEPKTEVTPTTPETVDKKKPVVGPQAPATPPVVEKTEASQPTDAGAALSYLASIVQQATRAQAHLAPPNAIPATPPPTNTHTPSFLGAEEYDPTAPLLSDAHAHAYPPPPYPNPEPRSSEPETPHQLHLHYIIAAPWSLSPNPSCRVCTLHRFCDVHYPTSSISRVSVDLCPHSALTFQFWTGDKRNVRGMWRLSVRSFGDCDCAGSAKLSPGDALPELAHRAGREFVNGLGYVGYDERYGEYGYTQRDRVFLEREIRRKLRCLQWNQLDSLERFEWERAVRVRAEERTRGSEFARIYRAERKLEDRRDANVLAKRAERSMVEKMAAKRSVKPLVRKRKVEESSPSPVVKKRKTGLDRVNEKKRKAAEDLEEGEVSSEQETRKVVGVRKVKASGRKRRVVLEDDEFEDELA